MPSNPTEVSQLPFDADPWLWWQKQRDVLLQGSTLRRNQKPSEIGVLAEKRNGEAWPEEIKIAPYYRDNETRIATGTITAETAADIDTMKRIRNGLVRLKTARPVKEQLDAALPAIGANPSAGSRSEDLTGSGVVIGFIDNGCAFAHPNFMTKEGIRSRVERMWDQSSTSPTSGTYSGWQVPRSFGYGREIDLTKVDMRTGTPDAPSDATPPCDPGELYGKIDYDLTESVAGMIIPAEVTHGTHVMDIAAGSGAIQGMAPDADLIFVQLPQSAITENTDQASVQHLLDGVAYVFEQAGHRPAVVNISYNAYTGPHDGTSLLECGLDELLQKKGRAVVISAANAGNKKCHAGGRIAQKNKRVLAWEVHPDDDTENFMEIWYPGSTTLQVIVTPPGANRSTVGVEPGHYCMIMSGDQPIGMVIHRGGDPGNGDNQVLIAVNPTAKHPTDRTDEEDVWREAPAGTWQVELLNTGANDVMFNAWIERDDRGRDPQAEQSCFADEDAIEETTLGGLCTGLRPLVVGAYNSATEAMEEYSAAGPTVDGRQKPEICAPGASDPNGFGILAAAACSANPVRMNGTSMSAPFVTGLVALLFQRAYREDHQLLDTDVVRQILVRTAVPLAGANPAAAGAGRIDASAALVLLEQRLKARRSRLSR